MNPIKPGDNSSSTTSSKTQQTIQLPAESKFLGISKKRQSAVFEFTSIAGEKSKIEVPKEQILKDIQDVLSGDRKIKEIPHLKESNLNQVVNFYYKQNLLPSSTIELIRTKQSRPKAEALAKKPTPQASTTDTIVASKDDTSSQPGKALPVENFSMKDGANEFLKGLFSEQKSKTKMLTEDLAPHFRYILGKPNLTDKDIREAKLNSTSNSQETTNLKRLRDDFFKALVKNETASLPIWLKTELGTKVSENLEAILYDTASHVHRQVLHQLDKGKKSDFKVIDNQIQAYIKATNIMASIVKRQKTES